MACTLDGIIPGDEAGAAKNSRPLMARHLRRQFAALSLRCKADPEACADPVQLDALLTRLRSASGRASGDVFDDPGLAAWMWWTIGDAAVMRDPRHLDRLAGLVALLERDESTLRSLAAESAPGAPLCCRLGDPRPGLDSIQRQVSEKIPGLTPGQGDPHAAAARLAAILDEVAAAWPAMGRMAAEHTRLYLLVQGASFGSPTYTPGVVLVSDDGLADMTGEHLVHEAVHQVLFCLEVETPLWNGAMGRDYVSEWSARKRARKAYAHIGFVYVAIAEYWHRRRAACPADADFANDRLAAVTAGLDVFFERQVGRDWLTDRGRSLFDQLQERYRLRRPAFVTRECADPA